MFERSSIFVLRYYVLWFQIRSKTKIVHQYWSHDRQLNTIPFAWLCNWSSTQGLKGKKMPNDRIILSQTAHYSRECTTMHDWVSFVNGSNPEQRNFEVFVPFLMNHFYVKTPSFSVIYQYYQFNELIWARNKIWDGDTKQKTLLEEESACGDDGQKGLFFSRFWIFHKEGDHYKLWSYSLYHCLSLVFFSLILSIF